MLKELSKTSKNINKFLNEYDDSLGQIRKRSREQPSNCGRSDGTLLALNGNRSNVSLGILTIVKLVFKMRSKSESFTSKFSK